MNRSHAILLFLRDAAAEARAKPLPTRVGGASGYRALNSSIVRAASRWRGAVDADLVLTGDTPGAAPDHRIEQRGRNFGERITNAIADCRALGYRHVVVLGNDCLDATAEDIAEAFAALDAGSTVAAAPAHDGGSWLIGVDAEQLNAQEFCALPWRTAALFEAMMTLPGATAVAQLRHDFDTWSSADGQNALAQLLGYTLQTTQTSRIQAYTLDSSTRKALTRLSLPAPPFAT